MKSINILDCTLRDGGYINEWKFGKENITNILNGLEKSKVNIIECGYLNDKNIYDNSFTMFSSFESLEELLKDRNTKDRTYVAMVNYGDFDVNNIPEYDGKSIKAVRVCFHKKNTKPALEHCKIIKSKGYKVFVQPMMTVTLSDLELLNLIEDCNEMDADALYIVDSFGSLNKEGLCRMAYLVDNNLTSDIAIGFHGHNNLQLAFANAMSFMKCIKKREIILDSSIFGMGRGAGNLNTELIVDHCNKYFETEYEIEPLLDVIENIIFNIHNTKYWGYSVAHYLSGSNNCHPNYATFFVNKKTLNVQNINELLNKIPEDMKYEFHKAYAEELYVKFNERYVNDAEVYDDIREYVNNKEVVIIAPGRSVETKLQEIKDLISKEGVVSFWVNYYDHRLKTDYIFVNNKRRLAEVEKNLSREVNLILTSNIEKSHLTKYVVDYKNLLSNSEEVNDNAVIMLINMLKAINVKKVNIAGFDGYSLEESKNYITEKLVMGNSVEELRERNIRITKLVEILEKEIEINFITESKYKK